MLCQAVFFRHTGGNFIILAAHVDDCTLAAETVEVVEAFKRELGLHDEATDLGELHWLLGMEIRRDRDTRTINTSQHSYVDAILRRYNMDELT